MSLIFILSAQYFIYVLLVIAGIYFLLQPWKIKKRLAIFGILSLILVGVFGFIANHTYDNPRPFAVEHFTPLIPHAPDNGFPSDHVLVAVAVAAVVFVFNRKVGIALGIIAGLIAVSRVYVGVHHPLDVIGSTTIAIVSVLIAHLICKNTRIL